jgi:hypothetical protein
MIEAILILSGTGVEKVSSTVIYCEPGMLWMGRRLTWVTFWSHRAFKMSSSESSIGIPKISPTFVWNERLGRETAAGLPARVCMSSSACCWARLMGATDRSPSGRTVSPVCLRRWRKWPYVRPHVLLSRCYLLSMFLKFGRSSVSWIMTEWG